MKNTGSLGIWMDYTSAHIMEFNANITTQIVQSAFTYQDNETGAPKSEKQINQKEQDQKVAYYKKLGGIIKEYQSVLLFGPTNAKVELFNYLKKDLLFANIEIEVKRADKMTENQEHAFVREHFAQHKSA